MTVSPRCRPGHAQLRPVERRRRQDDSPEAVLLSLAAEIRSLSAERPFSEELLLMEQVFVLLLDGFRRQVLPDGRVGLLPPQAGVAIPEDDQPLVIASLLKAGMAWVEVEGQASLLCFPPRLGAA
ncbi:MAG: hypothetical protein WCQ20_01670 [Synechococcaceae cyanobacterium ELA739]